MSEVVLKTKTQSDGRKRKLILGILFDLIGYFSYAIPGLGESMDIIWAPISGILLKLMYKGTVGTVGGIFTFVEELLPGLDFVPTFTITWIYTYWKKK